MRLGWSNEAWVQLLARPLALIVWRKVEFIVQSSDVQRQPQVRSRTISKRTVPFKVGVEYYRAPAPDPGFWEEDFAAIAEAGFDMIRTFSFWNWIEPEPGVYQLDDFDLFFELAAKYDLEVVFDFTLATHGSCPEWMLRQYPDIRFVDNEGQVAEPTASAATPQGSMIHCYDHPKWEEHGRQLIQTIVTRYREAPSLGVWSVWDGIWAPPCYCQHSIAAYREWLQHRFTLHELNERLYRRYRNWDDVQPPRSNHAIVEMLLFKQFRYENLAQKLRWQVKLINDLDGQHEIHAHGTHFPRPWDEMCAAQVDSWGFSCRSNDLFTSDDPYRFADQFLWARWSRAVGRQGRWWYDEIYSSLVPKDRPYAKRTQPEELRAILWMTVAEAGAIAQFWQYRPEYMSFEAPGLSLVGLNGLPTDRLTAVSQTVGEIKSIQHHLPVTIPQPQVGIVYHKWSDEVSGLRPDSPDYYQALIQWHRSLWENNIPVDVITPAMDWEPYRVICLPNILLLDDQLIEKITNLMNTSPDTHFIAAGLLGLHAADGRFSYDPPEGLSDLLGVQALDYGRLTRRDIMLGNNVVRTGLGELSISSACDYATLQPLGSTTAFAQIGDEIVGVQTADKRFTWISFPLDAALARAALANFVNELVNSCAIHLPVETRGDKLIIQCRRSAQGGWLLFIFNLAPATATAEVQPAFDFARATELLTATELSVEDHSFTATVEPWSLSVVYCSPPDAAS